MRIQEAIATQKPDEFGHLPACEELYMHIFENCTSLTTVDAPKALCVSFSDFQNCTALTMSDFSSATSTEGYAFCGCTALTSVSLSTLEYVCEEDFYNCSKLASTIDLSAATEIETYTSAMLFSIELLLQS